MSISGRSPEPALRAAQPVQCHHALRIVNFARGSGNNQALLNF